MAQQQQADTVAPSAEPTTAEPETAEPETAEPSTWEPAASAAAAPVEQGQAASADETPAESLHATTTWETPSEWEAPPADRPAADLSGMPEEQPFERGGRWWFKRGQELLVYEEQTAQWVPAPATEIPAAEPEPGPVGGPATQSGFWRCPSCGAINGSTASTCRMCFAARP
ncbi:MAG: hypothetical protein M3454_15060 [Actinomycetota bacterium]|nr:hypothetical protein [Actinomycetota bacterium]